MHEIFLTSEFCNLVTHSRSKTLITMCIRTSYVNIILHNNKDYTWEYKTLYDTKQFFNQLGFILLHLEQTSNINLNSLKTKVISFMPTHLYLTTHINANRVRQLRSNFLAYQTSLGLSGGFEQSSIYSFGKTSLRLNGNGSRTVYI